MKILINALSGIGDALMFSPALRLLHEKLPNYQIDFMVMYKSVKELYRYSPYIKNIYFIDFLNQPKLKSISELWQLRKNDYFISLNVYPSNRIEYNVVNYILGAKKRLANHYRNSSVFSMSFLNNICVDEIPDIHNVIQNVNLIRSLFEVNDDEIGALEINLNEDDENCAKLWMNKAGVNIDNPVIGLHPGSSTIKNHINKRWDKNKYAELGNKLINEKNASILIFGTETDLNNEINEMLGNRGVLASTSNYMDSMARVKLCDLFVSNDTAFLHSASAFNIPVVAIFGYTNYKELFPWKTQHIIVRKDLDCSPCFYNSPKPANCKWKGVDEFKCIKNITVDEVFAACETLLK